MRTLLDSSATKGSVIVWAALVVFTVASFALGGEHLIENKTLAAAVVLGIGAIKVRLVGLHFMELRGAPVAGSVSRTPYARTMRRARTTIPRPPSSAGPRAGSTPSTTAGATRR